MPSPAMEPPVVATSPEAGPRAAVPGGPGWGDERFRVLVESSRDLLCLHDPDGRYRYVSPSAASLLGFESGDLIGRDPYDFFHPQDAREHVRGGHERALNGRVDHSTRYRFRHRDGHYIWLETLVVPLFEDAACPARVTSLLTSSREVTAQVAAASLLATSEERLRLALLATGAGICDVQFPAQTGYFSAGYLQVFGYGADALPLFAEGWQPLVHPDDLPVFLAARQRLTSGLDGHFVHEVRRMHRDGSHVWLRMMGRVVERGADGLPSRLIGTLVDVDERRRSDAALREARDQVRELSSHLEDGLDRERKRIALDVHDELGQRLTAMKLQLELLQSQLGCADEARRTAAQMRELIEETMEVTRNVALNLRPPALDLGLEAALEWLAEDFSLRSEIECAVDTATANLPLDDKQAIALYRIAQESLTNVARHASARRVQVRLALQGAGLALSISDDGVGFDPSQAPPAGHFGLLGMRERAWRLGAEFVVSSQPGAGCTVWVRLPGFGEASA